MEKNKNEGIGLRWVLLAMTAACLVGAGLALVTGGRAEESKAEVTIAEVLAKPQAVDSYTLTEICQHVDDAGYEVSGTVNYTITADTLKPLTDDLPGIVRGTVAAAIGEGIVTEVAFNDLCRLVL